VNSNDLHRQLQMLLAGHPIDLVIPAVIDSLAAAIGIAAGSIDDADKVAEAAANDIKAAMRRNWPVIAEARTRMTGTSRG